MLKRQRLATFNCIHQVCKLSISNEARESNLNENRSQSDKKNQQTGTNFASYFFLAIPATTFCLGFWQIKKRNDKKKLIMTLEDRMNTEPVSLPISINNLEEFIEKNEYKPFRVKGYFLNSKEILLTTRFDVTLESKLPGGYLITPFVLSEDTTKIILINRGFIPFTDFSESSRSRFRINDEVELAGFLRSDEPRCALSHQNKPPNEWHIRNLTEISQQLGTEPIFLDQVKPFGLPLEPIPTQTKVDLKNDHLNYIFTWFGLSFTSFFIWLKLFSKFLA